MTLFSKITSLFQRNFRILCESIQEQQSNKYIDTQINHTKKTPPVCKGIKKADIR